MDLMDIFAIIQRGPGVQKAISGKLGPSRPNCFSERAGGFRGKKLEIRGKSGAKKFRAMVFEDHKLLKRSGSVFETIAALAG